MMLRWCLALLAALWVLVLAERGAAAYERLVLAVGSNHGLDHEIPLRYATRDAERFARVMTELGQVESANVRLLQEPSKAELLTALRGFGERAGSAGMLIVYYSGHGSKEALHLRGERLSLAELRSAVLVVRAQLRLLFVDACRGIASKGFSRDQPFEIQMRNQHRGVVVMHSTGAGEVALESNRLEAGVFSHFLVSGMRGPADSDRDHRVSLNEAYNYARNHTLDRTRRMNGGEGQDPVLDIDVEGAGPVVLTRVDGARSLLILPPGPPARYVVVATGSQAEMVRAWSSPDRAIRFALPGDQFVVYRAAAAGVPAGVAEVTLPFGGVHQLKEDEFQPLRSDAGQPRGTDDGDLGLRLNSLAGASLYPHRITLGTGPLVGIDARLGQGAALSYAYGTSGWLPAASLTLSRLAFRTAENEALRTRAHVAAGARYRSVLDTFNVHAGVGFAVSVLSQELISRRGGSGGRPDVRSTTAGLGGQVDLGVSLPLRGWLATDLGLIGQASGFRQAAPGSAEAGARVALDASVLLTLGLSLGL